MELLNFVAQKILGDLSDHTPSTRTYKTRKEKNGYTIFFIDTLNAFYLDNFAYIFFVEIDDKKTCFEIIKQIHKTTKLPLLIVAHLIKHFTKVFQQIGLIEPLTKATTPKQLREPKEYIPSAPNQVAMLLTNECNLRCSHCGNENRERKENELTQQEWKNIIDECTQMGVFIFNVSGGEPFMRPDWYEILKYARNKGIEVAITSNGTLIDEELAQKLKKLETFNIHISLDGVGAVHDNFRNQKGTFEKVINTISIFKKYQIPFGITTAVSKRNLANLDALAEFIDTNKISSWEIYSAIPFGCMQKKEALNKTETLELANKISDFRKNLKDTKIFVGDNLGYFDSLNTQPNWLGCRAGISICAIDSEGNVKGCPIHPNILVEGNLRQKTFSEIWNSKLSFSYNRDKKPKLKKHCAKCSQAAICRGGCKASMYSWSNNFECNDYCLKIIESASKKSAND